MIKKKLSSLVPKKLTEIVVKGMLEKKGNEITVLDLRKIPTVFTDFFVICSADSVRQVAAITESVENEIALATGQTKCHKEGQKQNEWVLLDYLNVIVHIFLKEKRAYYAIEELWGDAIISRITQNGSKNGSPNGFKNKSVTN